ncbi:Arylsulfatase [Planctomycetes bacterium Pan216]|uniref:Arylsulfatase n=1 Tax=Kolteria novifilia TaxID=2527975 RepID=A0A518B0C2_9BACT|nr:Arylsulfatase [Planctomycetes bacterium Pan216]
MRPSVTDRLSRLILHSTWMLTCLLAVAPAQSAGAEETKRPNIIFLLSDDQRVDTITALGNDRIKTPNLDRLVRRGFIFDNTYCMGSMSAAVCAPSRAMILTGRTLWHNPIGFSVPWKGTKQTRGKTPHITMPKFFRDHGYATFCTGKWHQGSPTAIEGFTAGDNIFFGGMGNHEELPLTSLERVSQGKGATKSSTFSSEAFASAAVDFLRRRHSEESASSQPFFMYISFTAPHDPRTPPSDYRYDADTMTVPRNFLPEHPFDNGELTIRDEKLAAFPRSKKAVRQHLADYYGMITHLDAHVGRVLEALRDTGEADNTLVVFTSDHGLAIGSHGLLGKQNLYEHSMKAPLIFAGPGIEEGSSAALVYLFDIFPTLAEYAGLPVPVSVEGKSLLPIIDGKSDSVRDSAFLAYRDLQRAVREGKWKLIEYAVKGKRTTQLFDLESDPDEVHNLAADPKYKAIRERLSVKLGDWQEKLDDPARSKFQG